MNDPIVASAVNSRMFTAPITAAPPKTSVGVTIGSP